MKTIIVTTTIRMPVVLREYCTNLEHFGHDDVEFLVVGDRKTPADLTDFASDLSRRSGLRVDYWDIARQQGYMSSFGGLDDLLPYDSIQRRNLGFLLSLESGAERIISIDDDNWPSDDDFAGSHAVVGQRISVPAVSSSSGWFNTASLLRVEPDRPVFHRGFPTSRREPDERHEFATRDGRVVVNVGLWTGVPDLDAISHLDVPVTSVGVRSDVPERLAVAPSTSLVFNTQNTAFHRDTVPAIFLPPMGGRIGDRVVGRHDDIWMSILLKPIVDHIGDLVTVGRPLVEQVRNEHDLFADALVELPAMQLTNKLIESVNGLPLTAHDYGSCYLEIVGGLRDDLTGGRYTSAEAVYLTTMTKNMERWATIAMELASR